MKIFLLIAFCVTICSILPYFFYRRIFLSLRRKIFFVGWLFLSCSFLLTRSFPASWPIVFVKSWSLVAGYWLIFTFYSFLIMILWYFLLLLDYLFFKKNIYKFQRKIVFIMLGIIFIACIYGTYNAKNPRIIHETVMTNKVSTPLKILLVSDLHLGKLLGKEYCEDLVKRINEQKVDVVIIAGDIIDDKWSYVADTGSYKPLKNLQSKYGTYAILGNHDYFTKNTELEMTALSEVKVVVLFNQAVHIGGIKIVGLDDYSHDKSSLSLERLSQGNADEFSVLVDHQPHRMHEAAALGYDLYLAGHTHEGQVFPNNLIVKAMYELSYGRGQFDNMVAYVTSGYGLWGVPMRLGTNPELVVLEIKPK